MSNMLVISNIWVRVFGESILTRKKKRFLNYIFNAKMKLLEILKRRKCKRKRKENRVKTRKGKA